MRPRRTIDTDLVLQLPGGNEDNDMWAKVGETDGQPWIESYWELSPKDLAELIDDGCIVLRLWGNVHPPIAMYVGEPIQRRHE